LKSPKKKIRAGLSLALTLALAFLALSYVRAHWAEFHQLWSMPLPPWLWAAILGVWALTLIANSEVLRLGVTAQGASLGFGEGLALNMSTMAANYIIPLKGGAGLRAYYLSTRHQMPLTNFLSQLLAVSVHTLATGSLLALVGLLSAAPSRGQGPLLAYFGGTFGLGLGSLLWLGRWPLQNHPRLANLARGWDVFRANPRLLARLTAWQLLYFGGLATVNRLCFGAFQIDLSWAQALFYSAGQIHSTIINLTPAGLGVVETFGILAGQILGFSPAEALMAQGLYRLTQLTILVSVGLWGWARLRRVQLPQAVGLSDPE
jgi:uncharacterized membrane protein YbhN (UPF0104 family)